MKAPGKRVVIAEHRDGERVAIGPVYTGRGAADIRALVESLPGWKVRETVRLTSLAVARNEGIGTGGAQ